MSIRGLDPITVTVKEACDLTGLQPWRMYELLSSGAIDGRYDKSKRLVNYRSLVQYIENLPQDAA